MIDDGLAAFLQSGIAINIGTRNERLEPNASHAPAAIVEPDRLHVTVFVRVWPPDPSPTTCTPTVRPRSFSPGLKTTGHAR